MRSPPVAGEVQEVNQAQAVEHALREAVDPAADVVEVVAWL